MRLTLSTLRCPDTVPPETRSVGGGEFSLGRAPDNSWVLQDPERHLSKRHCVFAFRNGGWQVADTSTNGTFLNREAEPIGQGRIRDLRDGDRVRLGAYEIEIRIEEAAFGAGTAGGGFGAGLGAAAPSRSASPFDDDPFAAAPLVVQGGSVSTGTGLGAGAAFGAEQAPVFGSDSPLLPADFDPLAPAEPDPFTGPSIADHTPAFSDAFRPPPVSPGFGAPSAAAPNILPDDWDLDEPLLPAQAAPAPAASVVPPVTAAPAPPPVAPSAAAADFLDDEPLLPTAAPVAPVALGAPVAPPPPAAPPVPFLDDEPLLPEAAPIVASPAPPVAPVAPAAPVAASPFAEPDDAPQPVAPVIAHQSAAAAAAAAAAAPLAAMAAPPVAAPPAAAADGALLAAFLRGAGLPDARVENPAAMMQELGAAFRATVSGLRAVLIARAAIKGEFRIEQTMIRAKGNNPLKFSADDDDALAAIFGARRAGMPPAQAIEEALRDMRLHELATMAAMQSAVRDILKWVAPEEAMASAGGGLVPMQKKARAFEAYEDIHKALVAALADDFDSVFGKSFARAYEEALREISARPEDR